jgi:hypothetical protein
MRNPALVRRITNPTAACIPVPGDVESLTVGVTARVLDVGLLAKVRRLASVADDVVVYPL